MQMEIGVSLDMLLTTYETDNPKRVSAQERLVAGIRSANGKRNIPLSNLLMVPHSLKCHGRA